MDALKGILTQSISIFVSVINFLILIRIILSWVRISGGFGNVIYNVTEPILAPIRNIIGNSALTKNISLMLDFSPIIAMFLIEFIANGLIKIINIML